MKVLLLLILLFLVLFILAIPLQISIQAGDDEPDLNNVPFWFGVGRSKSHNKTYQFTSLNWQVAGNSTGNDYNLTSPQGPSESSEGCCCTYLPCVFKNW
jgi:hypothetical protein